MVCKKKIFLLLTITLYILSSYGQTKDGNLKSTLIIAADKRSDVNRTWNSSTISNRIETLMRKIKVKPNCIAGVIYGIPNSSKTPKNFSQLVSNPEKSRVTMRSVLQCIKQKLPPSGKGFYSITSFAKPYALMALIKKMKTNRTFVVIISDGKYNGNDDYYGEFSKYVNPNFSLQGRKMFKTAIKNVQMNYFCEFISETAITGGYIQLFEYIPLQQYFALESVLNFPHKIIALRGKGKYIIRIPFSSVENKNYKIQKLQVRLYIKNKLTNTLTTSTNSKIKLRIEPKDKNDAQIELRSWVKLNDGVYNNTILHPDGSKLQGASGLTHIIKVEPEDNAKILGIIPLSDFLFYLSFWTSSQETAATVWGWIFVLSALGIIIYAIYRNNIYKVDPKEVKL